MRSKNATQNTAALQRVSRPRRSRTHRTSTSLQRSTESNPQRENVQFPPPPSKLKRKRVHVRVRHRGPGARLRSCRAVHAPCGVPDEDTPKKEQVRSFCFRKKTTRRHVGARSSEMNRGGRPKARGHGPSSPEIDQSTSPVGPTQPVITTSQRNSPELAPRKKTSRVPGTTTKLGQGSNMSLCQTASRNNTPDSANWN